MVFDQALHVVLQAFDASWWLLLFFILWPVFRSTWRFWREEQFVHAHTADSILLEMKIPREVRKSPRAMEQFLAAIHNLRNGPGTVADWWVAGEVPKWFSLEIASLGGEVHFYIRMPSKHRPIVEAAFSAYYQDVELIEVDDYVHRFPASVGEIYHQGYDVWGSEMGVVKPDAYPIKLYTDFEEPDEERSYDPIGNLVELMGKLRPEEIAAVQILIAPSGSEWTAHHKHLLDELKQRDAKKHGGSMMPSISFSEGILPVVGGGGHGDEKKDDGGFTKALLRSPGETDVLKAVEQNLTKPAFETLIRLIYLAPQPIFFDAFAKKGIAASFNQYATANLNAFKRLDKTETAKTGSFYAWPYIFPNRRNDFRKARILQAFRNRAMPPETLAGKILTSSLWSWNFGSEPFHMTTQCIATIFHPPTFLVMTAPHIQRMESKRAGPPAGAAIFSDESDLEQFT